MSDEAQDHTSTSNLFAIECPVCLLPPKTLAIWAACGHHYCVDCVKKLAICAICRARRIQCGGKHYLETYIKYDTHNDPFQLDEDDPNRQVVDTLKARVKYLKQQWKKAQPLLQDAQTQAEARRELQLKIDHCKERIDVKNHKIHELEATIEDNAAALKAAQEQAARMQALVQKQEESIRQVHDKLRKVKAQHEEDLLTRERFWKRTHGEQLPMIERLKADKHELARDVEGARANAAELEHMLAAALLAHKPDLTIQELHSSLHALGKGLLHGRPNGPVHAGALEYLKQTFETVRKEQVAALQEASAQVARLTQQLHVCQQQLRAARAAAKERKDPPGNPPARPQNLADITNTAQHRADMTTTGSSRAENAHPAEKATDDHFKEVVVLLDSEEDEDDVQGQGVAGHAPQHPEVYGRQHVEAPPGWEQALGGALGGMGAQPGTSSTLGTTGRSSFVTRGRTVVRGPDGRGGQCLVGVQGVKRTNFGSMSTFGVHPAAQRGKRQHTMDQYIAGKGK